MPKNFERRERRIAWLLLIMINNLNARGEADMWKCVDDTTISKLVDKGRESGISVKRKEMQKVQGKNQNLTLSV